MLRSRNEILIEANEGRGDINMRGKVKIDVAEIQTIQSPIFQDLKNQINEIRRLSSSIQTQQTPQPPQLLTQQQISPNNNINNSITLLNARMNTVEERLNIIEEKLKNYMISMDERINLIEKNTNIVVLSETTPSSSTLSSATTNEATINDLSTNESNNSSTTINSVKEAAQKLIILRKAPITSKNIKYAW